MNRMVIIAVAIIAIIALTLTGVLLLGMSLLNEDNDHAAILSVGDFTEYNRTGHVTVNFTDDAHWEYNEIDTIVAINSTHYLMNVTIFPSEYPLWNYSIEDSWLKNWTFGAYMDVDNPEFDVNLTKVGKESIDTNWGSLSCDHYIGNLYNSSVSFDVFVKNGILIEWATTSSSADRIEMIVFMLVDTNIPEITG